MACAACGNNCGGTCDVCRENPCSSCCKQPCMRWGFDGCFLRARCADGTELEPLNLCAWLSDHETPTELRLVTHTTDNDSYMEYINEYGESYKIYVCDFLGLSSIECLRDVQFDEDGPQSCDLMVFDPGCGSECSPTKDKWTNYHIPDAGECEIQPDENGFYHVLVKDECGCIKECKMLATTKSWEYALRDSWPDDPDWPFSMGSRIGENSEIIDLMLDQMIPVFGSTDLEVTIQYGYGIQNTLPASYSGGPGQYNFKSIVTPTYEPTHNPNVTDIITKAIVVQGSNLLPYGSWEWQVSRTFIVPRGKKLYLNHTIEMRDPNATLIREFWGESLAPDKDSSRLHALHVFVRATQGEIL